MLWYCNVYLSKNRRACFHASQSPIGLQYTMIYAFYPTTFFQLGVYERSVKQHIGKPSCKQYISLYLIKARLDVIFWFVQVLIVKLDSLNETLRYRLGLT